ncbi:MAG: c-type cytochrome, partial [Imperialibacter sp.]
MTDPSGESASTEAAVLAGNDLPQIAINFTGNQSFYWSNSTFNYEVSLTDAEDGSINKGIDPSSVTFTADYLERGHDLTEVMQGHQANMEASAHLVGQALVEASDCKACHQLKDKSVGPTFTDIANKYEGQQGAVENLVEKVIKGGSGVWGDLMMSPHPQLSNADTEKMIAYILSLNGKSVKGG